MRVRRLDQYTRHTACEHRNRLITRFKNKNPDVNVNQILANHYVARHEVILNRCNFSILFKYSKFLLFSAILLFVVFFMLRINLESRNNPYRANNRLFLTRVYACVSLFFLPFKNYNWVSRTRKSHASPHKRRSFIGTLHWPRFRDKWTTRSKICVTLVLCVFFHSSSNFLIYFFGIAKKFFRQPEW